MNTSVLGAFGSAVILATALSACASPAESPAPDSPAAETSAPTPTPSAVPAKTYSVEDLSAVIGQLQDSQGRKLSVMASSDLAGTLEQTKALLASVAVEPAECQALAAASVVPTVDGAVMAMGQSIDAASGALTALSLTAGLDKTVLGAVADQGPQLEKCANMTMTASGLEIAVSVTLVDGAGTIPDTVAYRTDTKLPDGSAQSLITAQAVQDGVLLTAVASGGPSEADAVSRAGALLDSAASQLK